MLDTPPRKAPTRTPSSRLSAACSRLQGASGAPCADPAAPAGPLRRVLDCGHPVLQAGGGRQENMLWSAYGRPYG
jgi:hypothetical protein